MSELELYKNEKIQLIDRSIKNAGFFNTISEFYLGIKFQERDPVLEKTLSIQQFFSSYSLEDVYESVNLTFIDFVISFMKESEAVCIGKLPDDLDIEFKQNESQNYGFPVIFVNFARDINYDPANEKARYNILQSSVFETSYSKFYFEMFQKYKSETGLKQLYPIQYFQWLKKNSLVGGTSQLYNFVPYYVLPKNLSDKLNSFNTKFKPKEVKDRIANLIKNSLDKKISVDSIFPQGSWYEEDEAINYLNSYLLVKYPKKNFKLRKIRNLNNFTMSTRISSFIEIEFEEEGEVQTILIPFLTVNDTSPKTITNDTSVVLDPASTQTQKIVENQRYIRYRTRGYLLWYLNTGLIMRKFFKKTLKTSDYPIATVFICYFIYNLLFTKYSTGEDNLLKQMAFSNIMGGPKLN